MRESDYLKYRGVRSVNRDVFLLNNREFVYAIDDLLVGLESLAQGLRGKRDSEGKSYVSFIPFLALMQRQTLSAFDHLASFQAYQAWVLVRPVVEIPLIMGKWVDDPAISEIWKKRETDPERYRKEYSGKKMRSTALPNSNRIQDVLKKLNDQFIHPNPFYYHRHLQCSRGENATILIEVEYFDLQEIIETHVLAFLHLIATMHDSVREMLVKLLGIISKGF